MKIISIFTVVLFTILITHASTEQPPLGARAIVLKKGVNTFIDSLLPSLITRLKNSVIPPVEGTQQIPFLGPVLYSVHDMKISDIKVGSFDLDLIPSDRIFAYVTLDLRLDFNWRYAQQGFPFARGTGSGFATTTQATASLIIGVNEKNGKVVIVEWSKQVIFRDFRIRLSGGIVAWLVDLFAGIFSSDVNQFVTNAIETGLTNYIQDINELIDSIEFIQPIPSTNIKFDFRLPESPVATVNYFRAGIRAVALPQSQQQIRTTSRKSRLPSRPINDKMAQIFVDDLTPSSMVDALYKGGDLEFDITHDMVPPTSPVKLNAATLSIYIRELAQFGNKNLKLSVKALSVPQVSTKSEGVTLVSHFELLWWLEEEPNQYKRLFTTLFDINAQLNVKFESNAIGNKFNLTGAIRGVQLGLELKESYMGPVDLDRFKMVLNIIIANGMVRAWNRDLVNGIPFDYLNDLWPAWAMFRNIIIDFNEGYISLTGNLFIEVPEEPLPTPKLRLWKNPIFAKLIDQLMVSL